MGVNYSGGRFGPVPYSKFSVDLSNADAAAMLSAGTELLRQVVKVAGFGVLAGVGLLLAGALLSVANTTSPAEPKLPLGSAPVFIKTNRRNFWGILLDDQIEFECGGQAGLIAPTDYISKWSIKSGWGDPVKRMSLMTVEGSQYSDIIVTNPTELKLATVVGPQSVDISLQPDYSGKLSYATTAEFLPPTLSDINALREKLKWVLKNNGDAIADILGRDTLKTFFNVDKI